MKNYLSLPIGAKCRLSLLKEIATSARKTWKEVRYRTYRNQYRTFNLDSKNPYFESDPSDIPGFRQCVPCNEILPWMTHSGWFTDHGQTNLVQGHVLIFRWGRLAYLIPATIHTDQDGHSIYMKDAISMVASEAWDEQGYKTSMLESAMREAAQKAENYAKEEAEESREANLKEDAQENIERLQSEVAATRLRIEEARKEFEVINLPPVLKALIEEDFITLENEIRSKLKAIKKWQDTPWDFYF